MSGALASEALLVAEAARVSVDDRVVVTGLSLATSGRRLVLAGGAALFGALSNVPLGTNDAAHAAAHNDSVPVTGRARASGGVLRLCGADVLTGAHLAIAAAAPLDPPFAVEWTVLEYLTVALRLGLSAQPKAPRSSSSEIGRRALDALALVGLGASDKRPIRSLAVPERRAMVIAAAVASGPRVLLLDRPLAGLDERAAAFVNKAIAAAGEGRDLVVSVDRVSPDSLDGVLARAASDVALFQGGELVAFGAPGDVLRRARLYRIVVCANADALKAALALRGMDLQGGPTQFSLATDAADTATEVLRVASEVRSAVVEIVPLM